MSHRESENQHGSSQLAILENCTKWPQRSARVINSPSNAQEATPGRNSIWGHWFEETTYYNSMSSVCTEKSPLSQYLGRGEGWEHCNCTGHPLGTIVKTTAKYRHQQVTHWKYASAQETGAEKDSRLRRLKIATVIGRVIGTQRSRSSRADRSWPDDTQTQQHDTPEQFIYRTSCVSQ